MGSPCIHTLHAQTYGVAYPFIPSEEMATGAPKTGPSSLMIDQLPSLPCSLSPSFSFSLSSGKLPGDFLGEEPDLTRPKCEISEFELRGRSKVDVTFSRVLLSSSPRRGLINDLAYSYA